MSIFVAAPIAYLSFEFTSILTRFINLPKTWMTKETIQSSFLSQVRSKLPPALSFADELAELLNISRDSAYRRIRGETLLSLDEVKKMCDHFRISLDQALSPSSADTVTFQVRALNTENFSFEKWLQSIYDNLQLIGQFTDKELTYNAKDLPIFHYFQYPLLSAFKMYFWLRFFARNPVNSTGKFYAGCVSQDMLSLGTRIWDKYQTLPSTEILSAEMLTATLRNIEFTRDCGLFENPGDALKLCDDCSTLVDRLNKQAESATKSGKVSAEDAHYMIYHNEILIGDNTILFRMGEKRVTYVIANNFDIMITSQDAFCRQTEEHFHNLIAKSTLISGNAQRERVKFFNRVSERIQETRKRLS